ncbi:MAG: DMT family transporter, partial [Duncaniella sp.]|nr:DMT family transporter [Duncaniella sp.]
DRRQRQMCIRDRGYFLMPFGMKYLRATTVSVYMNLQPIVASVTAIFIGQDIFSWEMPVAAVLVLLGAYTVSTSQARAQETDR